MLTAYQCELVAFSTEYGDILCRQCAHDQLDEGLENATFYPIIRYDLDEEQVARADWYIEEAGHVEDCQCLPDICCDACCVELVAAYKDPDCEQEVE